MDAYEQASANGSLKQVTQSPVTASGIHSKEGTPHADLSNNIERHRLIQKNAMAIKSNKKHVHISQMELQKPTNIRH